MTMEREEAIKTLQHCGTENYCRHYIVTGNCYGCNRREALDMAIEALQTIDNCDQCEWCCPSDGTPTIHVVRCKDCRHRDLFSCPLADNDFQKDEDFCSWGERREESEDEE